MNDRLTKPFSMDVSGYPIPDCETSGENTSSAQIKSGACLFVGVVVATDGTNDATVTCYNSLSATGTKLLPTFTVKGSDNIGGVMFSRPVQATTGVYLALSGSNAKANVYIKD